MHRRRLSDTAYSLGQTLAEIVVALGIILLIISALIVGGTAAIKSSDQNRLRTLAVGYAQEALEITRKLRDEDWTSFQAKSGLWCLDKAGVWTQAVAECPANIDNAFTRSVTFTWNTALSRMDVVTTLRWQDGAATHQTILTTFFTQWQ